MKTIFLLLLIKIRNNLPQECRLPLDSMVAAGCVAASKLVSGISYYHSSCKYSPTLVASHGEAPRGHECQGLGMWTIKHCILARKKSGLWNSCIGMAWLSWNQEVCLIEPKRVDEVKSTRCAIYTRHDV